MRLIDSHTGGEPTRVVVDGMPHLDGATMAQRRDALQRDWDHLRIAITHGADAPDGAVAAYLTSPVSADAIAGVIFADRAAYLGMCGHGSIGVVETLVHLGRLTDADRVLLLDTPAGSIRAERFDDRTVEIRNVASYAYRLGVAVDVPGIGTVIGDIAYGGNWFFLIDADDVLAENMPQLMHRTLAIHAALRSQGITGEAGAEIDHVELTGAPLRSDADAKNFVLCPSGEYDRSPCGTGTSAKMAVLAARGKLRAGDVWRQESITGSLFTGRIEAADEKSIIPFIRGRAYVTGEATVT